MQKINVLKVQLAMEKLQTAYAKLPEAKKKELTKNFEQSMKDIKQLFAACKTKGKWELVEDACLFTLGISTSVSFKLDDDNKLILNSFEAEQINCHECSYSDSKELGTLQEALTYAEEQLLIIANNELHELGHEGIRWEEL